MNYQLLLEGKLLHFFLIKNFTLITVQLHLIL